MGILSDIFKTLGISSSKRSKSGLPFPEPPDPGEVREIVEKVIEGIGEIKALPKTLINRATEAEKDFREADKSFRGARFRKKK